MNRTLKLTSMKRLAALTALGNGRKEKLKGEI